MTDVCYIVPLVVDVAAGAVIGRLINDEIVFGVIGFIRIFRVGIEIVTVKVLALTIDAAAVVTECALDSEQLGRFAVQVLGGFPFILGWTGFPPALTSTEDITPANPDTCAAVLFVAATASARAGPVYSILVEEFPYFGNFRVRPAVVVAVVCRLVVPLAGQLGMLIFASVSH